jgi:hypothetical protein
MSTAGDAVIVALNRGDDQELAANLPAGTYTDLVSGVTVTAPVQLDPRSARLLAPQ